MDTRELEARADVVVLLLCVDAALGVGEGCGDLTPCEDGGVSGLGSACPGCAASPMNVRAHKTRSPPRTTGNLVLTARVSPLLAVGSMLAQCDDQDNDRDHGNESHNDGVHNEQRVRDPRARVGRSAARVGR